MRESKLTVKKKGFTLVELLVTIGLLAVLSTGVISLIGPQSGRYKRDVRRKADLENIASALEFYRNDNSAYPQAANWENTLTSGTYMSAVPTDPKTPATHYGYTPAPAGCTTACRTYSLCATVENNGTPSSYCVTNP